MHGQPNIKSEILRWLSADHSRMRAYILYYTLPTNHLDLLLIPLTAMKYVSVCSMLVLSYVSRDQAQVEPPSTKP